MAEGTDESKLPWFKTLNNDEKQKILKNRKAENINKATELWVSCFKQYLLEKQLPILELLTTDDLPDILCNFYSEVKKKTPTKDKKVDKKSRTLKNLTLRNTKHHP